MFLNPASSHQLVWSPNWPIGAWGFPLLGAGFLHCIFTPTGLVSKLTDFLSSPSYIIVQRPPPSCGRHKLHSINPPTVKVILCYFSTGCTCYLHWGISYFDSPAGSWVNIQQSNYSCKINMQTGSPLLLFRLHHLSPFYYFHNENLNCSPSILYLLITNEYIHCIPHHKSKFIIQIIYK